MTDRASFIADMIETSKQQALEGALMRLLDSDNIKKVWPAAFEAREKGTPIQICDVEMIVLPLDRIGAPAGASGAGVYIAYYSHAPKAWMASPPLVVKIGNASNLEAEKKGADEWPQLPDQQVHRFARPIVLDKEDPNWGVLIAPFQSDFRVDEEGVRNNIKVKDLWRMLENKNELLSVDQMHWDKIGKCIGQALDAVYYPHRGNEAKRTIKPLPYGPAYEWYLRSTTGTGRLSHIPRLIFGTQDVLNAFGETWENPVILVEELIGKRTFEGYVGAVHGDLHPKNIVLNQDDDARIIDFGWARREAHIVQDYLLLDLNIRGTTLPSQLSEADVLAIASFLEPLQDEKDLPEVVRQRASIIKNVIWKKAKERAVNDWTTEYLIPLLLVGYGLLVHLDSARNQPALVATVLAAARAVRRNSKMVAA